MTKTFLERLKMSEADQIVDMDAPSAMSVYADIISKKPFLRKVYQDFYSRFNSLLNPNAGKVIVELGSGAGFIKQIIPHAITSDILQVSSVDLIFSGEHIPFKENSIDAFVMIDVFHHVKKAQPFLEEMNACLKPGGKILMIEPANTLWARHIWVNYHHEQFDPTSGWTIEGDGPMSDANGALPWIVFERDKSKFSQHFPQLTIESMTPHTPFRYLLSGGLTLKQLLPTITYPLIRGIELLLIPFNRWLGMFYFIQIKKAI